MYGLKRASKLANYYPTKNIADVYFQCKNTPGLWKHKWRPITFWLVVNYFSVKYAGKQHADHLLASIKKHFSVSVDWSGGLYCGIKLDWDYEHMTVDLSISR